MAQTDKQTHGHGDSMTNSAQWGRVGEKLLSFYSDIWKAVAYRNSDVNMVFQLVINTLSDFSLSHHLF